MFYGGGSLSMAQCQLHGRHSLPDKRRDGAGPQGAIGGRAGEELSRQSESWKRLLSRPFVLDEAPALI